MASSPVRGIGYSLTGVNILPKECRNMTGKIMPFWANWEEFTSNSTHTKFWGKFSIFKNSA
jgi:hypothetical protein